jgi:hypothetical protein
VIATSDVIAIGAAVIAFLAFGTSLFSLYWTNFRPAHISLTIAMVTATRNGGSHVSIPVSIANDGAQATTVTGVKLLESDGDSRSLYVAGLTTTPEKAIEPINGVVGKDDAALFVPFLVLAGTEIQKVFIFVPLSGPGLAGDLLAKSGKMIQYKIAVRTSQGDVSETKSVLWRPEVDSHLAQGRGVTQPTFDIGSWQETQP